MVVNRGVLPAAPTFCQRQLARRSFRAPAWENLVRDIYAKGQIPH
jgi:hypothetical protein